MVDMGLSFRDGGGHGRADERSQPGQRHGSGAAQTPEPCGGVIVLRVIPAVATCLILLAAPAAAAPEDVANDISN